MSELENIIARLCEKIDTLCGCVEEQHQELIEQNNKLVNRLVDRKVIPVSVFLIVVISIVGIFTTAKSLNSAIEKVPTLLHSSAQAITDIFTNTARAE